MVRIFLSVSLILVMSNNIAQAQLRELTKYKQIYSELDSSKYPYKTLIIEKYLNGNIKFLAIGVKKVSEGKERSFFLDSAKTFYKSGTLKKIQMRSPSGDPLYCKCFNEEGYLTKFCKHINDNPNTDLIETDYCYLYSDGILVEEGPYISRNKKLKRHGVHIFYKNESEIYKVIYENGRKIRLIKN